jgi:hypothetical protein
MADTAPSSSNSYSFVRPKPAAAQASAIEQVGLSGKGTEGVLDAAGRLWMPLAAFREGQIAISEGRFCKPE